MAVLVVGAQELRDLVGKDLPPSRWLTIDQARIDAFADATLDPQWIHVDSEQAASGPFGLTIAHGFLTLSLIPYFRKDVLHIDGFRMTLNYGVNRVRFPSPVPVGSRVRGMYEIIDISDVRGGVREIARVTVQREGHGKPVCVAETVVHHYD